MAACRLTPVCTQTALPWPLFHFLSQRILAPLPGASTEALVEDGGWEGGEEKPAGLSLALCASGNTTSHFSFSPGPIYNNCLLLLISPNLAQLLYHLNEKFIQLKPHLKKKSIVWSLTHLTHSANNATLVSGYWESKVLYFLDG